MKTILLILGVAVVALNLLLWYSKRRAAKTEADKPTNRKDKTNAPLADSNEFLNSSKAKPLKQSAAAELGISVEQLDRMPVEEIKELAAKKGLI
jgi:FtsZ-interacting cell division protein ZipA